MKQNRTYLAPLTWPSSIWPAQPTSSPLSSSSPRTEAARWRAPMPPRPPPASTEAFPSLPLTPPRCPDPLEPLDLSHRLPPFFGSLSPPPSGAPSPPTPFAVPTADALPPRSVQHLRHLAPRLSIEESQRRGPMEPPSSPSSSSLSDDRRRRFAAPRTSPSLLTAPSNSL